MRKTLLILLSLLVHNVANASLSLSLSEAIRLAQEHSLDAQVARFTFPGSYWTYRSYRAELLPRDPLHNTLFERMNQFPCPDGTDIGNVSDAGTILPGRTCFRSQPVHHGDKTVPDFNLKQNGQELKSVRMKGLHGLR